MSANPPCDEAPRSPPPSAGLLELLRSQETNPTQGLSEDAAAFHSQNNLNALQALLGHGPHHLRFNPAGVVGAVDEPEAAEPALPPRLESAQQPGETHIPGNLSPTLDCTIVFVALLGGPNAMPAVRSLPTTLPAQPRIAEVCETILEHPHLAEDPNLRLILEHEERFAVLLLQSNSFRILNRRDIGHAYAEGTVRVVAPLGAVLLGAAGTSAVRQSTDVPPEHQGNPPLPVILVHIIEDIDRLIESQRMVSMIGRRIQTRLSTFQAQLHSGRQYLHSVYLAIACYLFCREVFANLSGTPIDALPLDLNGASTPLSRLPGQPTIGMQHIIQTLPMLLNDHEQHLAMSLGGRVHRLLSQGRVSSGGPQPASPSALDVILHHDPTSATPYDIVHVMSIQQQEVESVLEALEM